MAKLKTSAAQMVSDARARIKEVETAEAIAMVDDPKVVIVDIHCASGWRSALTVATLQDMGFDAAHLREGFSTWEAQGGPVERSPKSEK